MSVLAECSASLDVALVADARALSPDDQIADLRLIAEIRNKADALMAKRAAVARETDATVETCGRQVKGMLNEELLIALPDASRALRHGRVLVEAPLLEQASLAGDLGREQALLIGKAMSQVDLDLRSIVEEQLVGLALQVPPERLRIAVTEIMDRLSDDDAKRAAYERRYAERGVASAETLGGFGSLSGTLTPATQDKLRRYMSAAADKVGPEDERTLRQRHHDALDELLDLGLADSGEATPDASPTALVTVTIDADALMQLVIMHDAVADLGTGARISAEHVRRIACDASILPVVLGGDRQILDVGRARRAFSRACRHAALIRDRRHCAFPRCRKPPRRFHHIVHWAHGGPSDLENCAPLCEFHHWLVHDGGRTVRRLRDRHYEWTGPYGQVLQTPRDSQAA